MSEVGAPQRFRAPTLTGNPGSAAELCWEYLFAVLESMASQTLFVSDPVLEQLTCNVSNLLDHTWKLHAWFIGLK